MIVQEVIIGVGLFTGIVLALTIFVLLTRAWLVAGGRVTVTVNDERDLQVPVGSKLLAALTANDLFLPSACGGGASCGQCRVEVLEGGGVILPTELSFISKREAAECQRLACQVEVSRNMRIRVPEAVFGVKRRECRVRSNTSVSTFIKEIILEMPAGETLDFRAGGYVQIECPAHHLRFAEFDIPGEYRNDWERCGFIELESRSDTAVTRAYSMANYPDENDIVMLDVRIATPPPKAPSGTPPGVVSSYIFSLKSGDPVVMSGPFGAFFANESDAEMIFVGGGAGMAPMRSHIFDQLKRINSNRKISFWYGARSLREAFYVDQFERLAREHENFRWCLVLSEPLPEDNWSGDTGLVHEVLFEHYLKDHAAPEDCEYYLCGPPMMNSALTHMLDECGVEGDNIFFDDFGG